MGGVFGLTTSATSTLAQFSRFNKSFALSELAHEIEGTIMPPSEPAAWHAMWLRDSAQSTDREPIRN